MSDIQRLVRKAYAEDSEAIRELLSILLKYFEGREWELPTLSEFKLVREANELLAWVLLFGRKPNHFTIAIHLLSNFKTLTAFHDFINLNTNFSLNTEGGIIKGNKQAGLIQSSTMGELIKVPLKNGEILIPDRFIEFIWQYPKNDFRKGVMWNDFNTSFIAENANKVIESLCESAI